MIAFVEIPYPALCVQWSWKVQLSIETDGIPVTTLSHESQLLSSNTNIETEDSQSSLMSINHSKRWNLKLHQNPYAFHHFCPPNVSFPEKAGTIWVTFAKNPNCSQQGSCSRDTRSRYITSVTWLSWHLLSSWHQVQGRCYPGQGWHLANDFSQRKLNTLFLSKLQMVCNEELTLYKWPHPTLLEWHSSGRADPNKRQWSILFPPLDDNGAQSVVIIGRVRVTLAVAVVRRPTHSNQLRPDWQIWVKFLPHWVIGEEICCC